MKVKIISLLVLMLFILSCAKTAPQNPAPQPVLTPTPVVVPEPVPAPIPDINNSLKEEQEKSPTNMTPKVPDQNITKSNQSMLSDSRCFDPDVDAAHPDGINFDVKTDIFINGKKIINGYDYCANAITISEWYCQNGLARVKTTKCPNGCKDGVCL